MNINEPPIITDEILCKEKLLKPDPIYYKKIKYLKKQKKEEEKEKKCCIIS